MDDNNHCPYCNDMLNEDERHIELPCFHRAHTLCFLNLMNNPTHTFPGEFHACMICHNPLFFELENEEVQQEEEEDIEQEDNPPISPSEPSVPNYYERVRIRVNGDANIKKDIKLYFKAKYNAARKRTALLKYVREKKAEISTSVENLREQLRNLIRAQKRTILQSQPYKEYKGAHFRKNIAGSNLYKKYQLDLSDIRKAMHGQPGFKRWHRESIWRTSPNYILRRGFYRSYFRI